MKNFREQATSPDQTYNLVQNLLRNDSGSGQSVEDAIAICYNYLTQQKKPQWSIYLQKLVQLFLDLAFQTNKHSRVKDVFKSYRAITQNQHPDSLKSVLQYYRDNKLQNIIDQQNLKNPQYIQILRKSHSLELDQSSTNLFLSSFDIAKKAKIQQMRNNLKIIWEGYKVIIDTVRFNWKFEGVYRNTLKKLFDFTRTFNRSYEFKSFCEYIRSGLRSVINKRGDKTQQQKGFYIDIQKQQINTGNIQVRLQQFPLAVQLGLWSQAFMLLQDIYDIMKVRKNPMKNGIKCSYFLNLAEIFKKSHYYHYHAIALFNYYSIYITKSKLDISQKRNLSDKVILSILCIPPSTLQKNQSKQSQNKIANMLLSGGKVPTKQQLQQTIISRGVIQNASQSIKDLWYFMLLDFDLSSLDKGLKILQRISKQGEYSQFIALLQDILIFKQLISIAQVYQRIKYSKLLSIIPLPKQKIQKVLVDCHNRKVIDFVFDQKQGIVIFQSSKAQINPYEQFLTCYNQIALLRQQTRKDDKAFILKKTNDFINTAFNYYNQQREGKIIQYKRKIRQQQDLVAKYHDAALRKDQQQKRQKQIQRAQREIQQNEAKQQEKKLFIQKKVRISQIITIKQKRVVKIGDRRIQQLTDQQVKSMDKSIFEDLLKQVTQKVAEQNQNRNKKRFIKVDYFERQRRCKIKQIVQKQLLNQQKQKQQFQKMKKLSKQQFDQKLALKNKIQAISGQVKDKINKHFNETSQKFENDLKSFKDNVTSQFKKKILAKARQLKQAVQKKRAQQQQRRRSQQIDNSYSGAWNFSGVSRSNQFGAPVAQNKPKQVQQQWGRKAPSKTVQVQQSKPIENKKPIDSWQRKTNNTTGIKESTGFSGIKDQAQQTKNQSAWIGKKKQQNTQQPQKFVAPSTQSKWGKGSVNVNQTKKKQPQLNIKKKDQKPKGRGW